MNQGKVGSRNLSNKLFKSTKFHKHKFNFNYAIYIKKFNKTEIQKQTFKLCNIFKIENFFY